MSIPDEYLEKFIKLGELCKKVWNTRVPTNEFLDLIKKEFTKTDIEIFLKFFIKNPKKVNNLLNEYVLSLISEDLSVVFSDIDLENPLEVTDARKIIEMCKVDSFNTLPVYSEKSSNTALNILIVILLNDNKKETKKDVLKLAQSPYFSILVSSGRLFSPEKFKQAQILFKKNDPFDCPIFQLPITQVHLVMALFPDILMVPFHFNDKFKNTFFIFVIFQLIILDTSNIKLYTIDTTLSYVFCSFLSFYLVKPTYILSFFLNTFPKKHFKSNKIIKFKDLFLTREDENYNIESSFYSTCYRNSYQINVNLNSNYSSDSINDRENILQFLFNKNQQKNSHLFSSNIINEMLPNGLLPTYEDALDFLTKKPESISMETLIEDALHYPEFTHEVANIFMQKLIEKDYQTEMILGNQILKRIDDIRVTWIEELVFFPIMRALSECLIEINDEYQFEILFFLFISLFEGCTRQGDEEVLTVLTQFISTINESFCLYLNNLLNFTNEITICHINDSNEGKPFNKLINFLQVCKETNDIDTNMIMKYPYLFISAYIWGVKTTHPNSFKILSLKFPKYGIIKRFFVYLSSCHKYNCSSSLNDSTSLIYAISSSDFSYVLLSKFPPSEEREIRSIIIKHLQLVSSSKSKINEYYGIILSWRAWMKMFSIEKFVAILLQTIIWAGKDKFDETKMRSYFLYAGRILASILLNPIKIIVSLLNENQMKFNTTTNKFENNENINIEDSLYEKSDEALKRSIWAEIEFIQTFDGSYYDGFSFASFCILLIISIKNNWKAEFKKILEFSIQMMKNSEFKSLKYAFSSNFLFISMSILEIQDLINIERFDSEFLQMNWRFGINFFFIHSEIERLKKHNIIKIE